MSPVPPTTTPIGIVLFQLGGPDSLDAVEPFLYNLFSDPDIIEFPLARIARHPLARFIAARRAGKVRQAYEILGGKSPINELTRRQAEALQRELSKEINARVVVAMRYWHPLTEEAIRRLVNENCTTEVVLLPLYPQYCRVTTGSSLNEWHRQYARLARNHTSVRLIPHFHDHPAYIYALNQHIAQALHQFQGSGSIHFVFSAHGVPAEVVAKGDPYQRQVEATARLVMKQGGWKHPYRICYQSKVGPGRWLEPSLTATLRDLAVAGEENVMVVPVSFVSDHIETLHEIDGEARALANDLDIRQFVLMPALNDSPYFIRALATLVREALQAGPSAGWDVLDSFRP